VNIRYLLLIVVVALRAGLLHGQVINNRIENRISLRLDETSFSSFTTQSDVQWDCINKALTSRCLVYHNDQWFTITPPSIGPYFINIHNQHCKNAYGVQLVILEGDPCKTDSYQLKRCVPFSDQADFYVRLDSLTPNQEYLINVDGFLGDLCSFHIAFSTSLQGIPVNAENLHRLTSTAGITDSVVSIGWSMSDSLAFTVKDFQVYRKKDKSRSELVASIPVIHNAYGTTQHNYQAFDTIHAKGSYVYSIYGSVSDDVLLLSQEFVKFQGQRPQQISRRASSLKREFTYYATGTEMVTVHIFDREHDKRLMTTNRRAEKGKNTLLLNFSEMADQGVRSFKIVISGRSVAEEFEVNIDP
jgi:hypothetical protein